MEHIDLHTHSTASDGLFAPAELLRQAHEAGLTAIALTDHDSTAGLAEAFAAGTTYGVEVIPGVEINTDLPNQSGEAHVLGYFLDYTHEDFQTKLSERRGQREQRGKTMVENLRKIGIPITYDMVKKHADGAVGRPHVAAALIEIGAANSVADAFDKYLKRGKPGYAPRNPFSPNEAVRLITAADGLASLAHPLFIADLERHLAELVDIGLKGLEVYYGEYSAADVASLLLLCQKYSLIPTGGSDYHGPGIHATSLGARYVPPESLTRLRSLKAK